MRATAKRLILLVEDNPGDAALVTEFLQARTPQHEVRQRLAAVVESSFDAIVTLPATPSS